MSELRTTAESSVPPLDPQAASWLTKSYRSWRVRHLHPFNFAIHMIGIPVAYGGLGLPFLLAWYWGVGAFVLGFVLQYIGHAVEGNDVGEWAGIKRLLGLPYVGVSPRFQTEAEKWN